MQRVHELSNLFSSKAGQTSPVLPLLEPFFSASCGFLQQLFGLFMYNCLKQRQALPGEIVEPVPLEAELQQFSQMVSVHVGQEGACLFDKVVIYAGLLRGSIFQDCFFAGQGLA